MLFSDCKLYLTVAFYSHYRSSSFLEKHCRDNDPLLFTYTAGSRSLRYTENMRLRHANQETIKRFEVRLESQRSNLFFGAKWGFLSVLGFRARNPRRWNYRNRIDCVQSTIRQTPSEDHYIKLSSPILLIYTYLIDRKAKARFTDETSTPLFHWSKIPL